MLNQEKMDCTKLVESGLAQQEISVLEQGTQQTRGLLSKKTSNSIFATPFESRGSAMLKAALNHKGRQENKAPSVERHNVSMIENNNETKLRERTLGFKHRKRNSVLFADPIVSKEYEYEPTFLVESEDDAESSIEESNQKEAPHERKIFSEHKTNSDRHVQLISRHTRSGFGTDSDDDELVVTLKSEEHVQKEEAQIRRSAKRSYESLYDTRDKQPTSIQRSSHESTSVSLFSSPKVAKIAPYFDEQPGNNTKIKPYSTCTKQSRHTPNQHRSRIKTTRLSLNKTGKFELNNNQIGSTELDKSKFRIEAPHPDNIYSGQMHSDLMEPNGFFGFCWLANGLSYLSNQMNKLIF